MNSMCSDLMLNISANIRYIYIYKLDDPLLSALANSLLAPLARKASPAQLASRL